MDLRCMLCDAATGSLRAIGALVVTGDVAHPDGGVLCRRCAALSAGKRRQLRDAAMTRMLNQSCRAAGAD